MTPFSTDDLLVADDSAFEAKALELFSYQARVCPVYKDFITHLKVNPAKVSSLSQIPFLPVELFKSHQVVSTSATPQIVFSSSGTTGMATSSHFVAYPELYKASFSRGFNLFYGNPAQYIILALLPGYLERQGSSLVFMVEHLIRHTHHPLSGFFLHNVDAMLHTLEKARETSRRVMLIGVTHALLNLAETLAPNLHDVIVMETGGMKGHGRERVREELHHLLNQKFNTQSIHSEYGMTELLSQGYSSGDGLFRCPPWMRILTRETDDPLSIRHDHRTGGINVIDLANAYSCSFIATQDLGRVHDDGSFEVSGRFDNSDVRGCNLLVV